MNYNQSAGTHVTISVSGATRPFTAFTGIGEQTTFIAPYDGTLQKVIFRSEEASVGSVAVLIGLHEAADGTEIPTMTPESSVTLTQAFTGDTSYEFDFSSVGHNNLTKGKIYGFTIDPAFDINDAIFTFVLKYDVTT